MPDVISNSSALQYLYQVEALNLLPSLFGQILVPEELARQRKVLADGLAREKNLAVAVLQRETENQAPGRQGGSRAAGAASLKVL